MPSPTMPWVSAWKRKVTFRERWRNIARPSSSPPRTQPIRTTPKDCSRWSINDEQNCSDLDLTSAAFRGGGLAGIAGLQSGTVLQIVERSAGLIRGLIVPLD